MKINAYLVITVNKSRYYNSSSASLRVTKGEPTLAGNEVAVKLNVNVPDEVFKRPVPVLSLDIPKEIVMNPDAEIVAELTAGTIAESLRLEVEDVKDSLVEMIKKARESENDRIPRN